MSRWTQAKPWQTPEWHAKRKAALARVDRLLREDDQGKRGLSDRGLDFLGAVLRFKLVPGYKSRPQLSGRRTAALEYEESLIFERAAQIIWRDDAGDLGKPRRVPLV